MCYLPHPYSTPILGVFPLHQIAHVGRQRAHGYITLRMHTHVIITDVSNLKFMIPAERCTWSCSATPSSYFSSTVPKSTDGTVGTVIFLS